MEIEEAGAIAGAGVAVDGGAGGEGDEAEGCEDGVGFAEGDVDGGAVAAEGVVIHAGKVVDDEGGAVEELDGGGGAEGRGRGCVEHSGDAEGEDGTDAAAGAEDGVAHGFADLGRGGAWQGRKERGEVGVDEAAVEGEAVEIELRGGHDSFLDSGGGVGVDFLRGIKARRPVARASTPDW